VSGRRAEQGRAIQGKQQRKRGENSWVGLARCKMRCNTAAADVWAVRAVGADEGRGITCPVARASRVRAFVAASLLRGVSPLRTQSRLRVSRAGYCVVLCMCERCVRKKTSGLTSASLLASERSHPPPYPRRHSTRPAKCTISGPCRTASRSRS